MSVRGNSPFPKGTSHTALYPGHSVTTDQSIPTVKLSLESSVDCQLGFMETGM